MKKYISVLTMITILPVAAQNNPLLQDWKGPNQGAPAFNEYRVEHFKPALELAMQEELKELQQIADNPKPATFENTIAAIEKTGKKLQRVMAVYYVYGSNISTPEFEAVQTEMEPKLASHRDQKIQNTKLFKRIEQVYNLREKAKLTPEQQRVAFKYYENYVLEGAKLDASSKTKLATLNQELAGLFTKFSQNLLAEENNQCLELQSASDLKGMPEDFKAAAMAKAKADGLKAVACIENTRSSVEPFLTYAENRQLREKAWRMFVNRGDNGNANDNNAVITNILRLRTQRAKLLGFETHADWKLSNTMAKKPENAMKLMMDVWQPAVAQVKAEVADMQKIVDAEGGKFKIEPWDYRYYAEKVRKSRYDLDQSEVKEYLQLDKLREGMFWVAGEMFNMNFIPMQGVQVFHPDVKVWEVRNKTTGKHIGLWYFDPYARKGKRSGAWMTEYRNQEKFNGEIPTIVSNNSNFIKGREGEPVLISWEDATTLFHEFGHALHGLASDVNYPMLAGTNVARDYVEFPSQILERWLSTPEVLQKYALHYKTNQPMPKSLLAKIENASKFNIGFDTVEYLSSALVDMKMHMTTAEIDPDKFEKQTLAELGMPSEIVMRHRIPQFGHLFSDDSYSAGYYSYLWADVISADAWEAFVEGKGAYDKEVGQKLLKHVFSSGNTTDQAEAFRSFRGRDAKVDALMRARNFPITK
ncbi:MAG TPA: M3 family metallopeptidase [Flavobacterium sp.]|jgi:peptidyl-dipeptidase Dcp